jgi:hypothetical protein
MEVDHLAAIAVLVLCPAYRAASPLTAKPRAAGGVADSHNMTLVLSSRYTTPR